MDVSMNTNIRDPVTGFVYPEDWVKRCGDPELLNLAKTGLGVLTSSGSVLRRGYTTGTTAAAACKAAILSLSGSVHEVRIKTPCGITVSIPVDAASGNAAAKKFAGDYRSDATSGLEFSARACVTGTGANLIAGEGIGRFCRDTPRFKRGEPAISTTAYNLILGEMEEAISSIMCPGVKVFLSVPDGADAARSTLNPKIGVLGGISILGSTGLVEPWEEHLTESAFERIRDAENPVLTTGRLGLRYSQMHFPSHEVVLIGSHLADALRSKPGKAILCGLPGLILRFIDPAILEGTDYSTVEEFVSSSAGRTRMGETLKAFKKRMPNVRIVILNRDGTILEDSR